MTDNIKRQIIAINRQLRTFRKVWAECIASGVTSASLSSGGASQSYTRMSVADMEKAIAKLETDKAKLLNGGRRRTCPNFL